MAVKREHELVPAHEIMSENEVKKLMQEMGVQTYNLPKILVTDPQAVKLGAKTGQILKIHRKDGENEYPYYRYVVED